MSQFYKASRNPFTRNSYLVLAVVVFVFIISALIFVKNINFNRQYLFLGKLIPIPPPTALNPNFLKQINECFFPTAAVYGYTLRITSGFRSMTEQAQEFSQGRTVNGHIVTWAEPGKSLHNYGFAVDVVDRWRGYNIDWVKLKKIGAFCGLEQVDDPHFEHRAGLTVEDFAAGKRPPPLTLPCSVMDQKFQASQSLAMQDIQSCNAPKF